MKESELIKLFGILAANYRNFVTNDTLPGLRTIWFQMFKSFPVEVIQNAVFEHMSTSKFPPTVADVKEIIYRQNTLTGYTFEEYWQILLNGYRKATVVVGGYSYWESYKDFPKELQELISYEQYHDLAYLDDYRRDREKERLRATLLARRDDTKREFLTSSDPATLLPHMQALLQLNTELHRKELTNE